MSDPIELHKHALSIAVELGYTGSAIDSFASRLRGSTRDEIREDARNLAKILRPKGKASEPTPNDAFNEWSGSEARLFSD
ncbi:MAG: hypothetical protein EKK42_15615 [Pseudonocardiaceae bacterium]|nr:MAG: hypothetical protein EKK42_15615 [Pseudonocardiaceae bacterium]